MTFNCCVFILAAVSLVGIATRAASAQAPAEAPPSATDEQDPFENAALPDDLFQIDTVVVTGRRSEERLGDSPVAVEVIDRAQIESSGARDAAQVLSTQPGLQIAGSFAGEAVQLQGLDPQHTLVLVDGERLVGARDGAIDLARFFAADIERIEIVRGPGSAIYGSDAMAGVINIITRPAAEQLSASLYGRYGATRGAVDALSPLGHHGDAWATVGGGLDTLRARVSGSFRRQAAFDLSPETPSTTGARADISSAQARLDWLPHERARVPLSIRAQRRDQVAIDESGSGAVYDRTTRFDELAIVLAPTFSLRERDTLSVSTSYGATRSQLARDQRGDDAGDDYEDALEQLASARVQHDVVVSDRWLLTSGIEALGQDFDSPRLSTHARRGRISHYAQADLTLTDRPRVYSVLVPSARVDVDSQYGVNASPRLALRVDPSDGLALRAAVGRGFRAPSFTELYLDFANPSANYRVSGNERLHPESSIGSSLSAEYFGTRWFVATLNLFRHDVRDLIDTRLVEVVGGTQQFAYVNVARALSQGVEATFRVQALSWLLLDLNYTLTRARDLARDRPLPGRALHRGALRIALGGRERRWSGSLRTLVVGERRFYEDSAEGDTDVTIAKPYVTADARAAYRIGEHVEPFLSGENLTNAGGPDLPLRPMTLFVGVTIL
jgi:outer membrane receptor for ferrienterochelin and colicins